MALTSRHARGVVGRNDSERRVLRLSVEAAVRIGVLAAIAAWVLLILRPFISVVLWASILAVALAPLHRRIAEWLGRRRRLAAGLLTLTGLALLLVPTFRFFSSTLQHARSFAASVRDGTLSVPEPPESVAQWPLIGGRVFDLWSHASTNLTETLTELQPELVSASEWLLGALGGLAGTVLQFAIAFVIMGLLLATEDRSQIFADRFATRLAGEKGPMFVELSVATVRSVFQGVLGIALIQALLAALGLVVVGVPVPMLWALAVLVLAVVQLPPLLVLAPAVVWVFAHEPTTVAVIFAIYSVVVSSADGFLKPLLLGRGVDVPMLVILLGAIGGMLSFGVMGLFLGPVVLAIAYQLLMAWIEGTPDRGLAETEVDGPATEPEAPPRGMGST